MRLLHALGKLTVNECSVSVVHKKETFVVSFFMVKAIFQGAELTTTKRVATN